MNVAVAIAIIISGIAVIAGALDRYTRWVYRRGQDSILREADKAKVEADRAHDKARIVALEDEVSTLKSKLDSM